MASRLVGVNAMEITAQQRRDLIALCCQMAWADGQVTTEERTQVVGLLERIGWNAVEAEDTQRWLDEGAPDVDIASLPPNLGQFAVYEVMRVMEADGEIDDRETTLVQRLIDRLYEGNPKDTPLARIVLAQRRVRPPK